MTDSFKLITNLEPRGDQPKAIRQLVEGYARTDKQTLLGITGSGKTFTMANVIAQVNKPTLVLVHNKTLAYQLYSELKELFPENKVEYFISYFDYYQPESYMPSTDTYIEKDSRTNKQIEQLRLRAMASLLSRKDVIIVCSISCLYGIGSPQDWAQMAVRLSVGDVIKHHELAEKLVAIQYERIPGDLDIGKFRIRGSTVDIMPGYEKVMYRIQFAGDKIDRIQELDPVSSKPIQTVSRLLIFPAKQYVVPADRVEKAIANIQKELQEYAPTLPELERQRIVSRTRYDIDMLREMGYCNGIENYSAHFEGRSFDAPPYCLLDFFPEDFLLIIDESHQTLPQAHAMHKGDAARKKNLIEHGFRLPSAYANRPHTFEEFETFFKHVIFVSATPGKYELSHSGQIVEQIVRPTGLLDPEIIIRPAQNQIDDVFAEIRKTTSTGFRVLVTTLTKRMAEDLTDYLATAGIRVRYLHSEIDSLERTEIIRQLRLGEFDVLVGINLLREGLDIPEVALVAVLNADQEGFLRDERSLIQTIGRAARNAEGKVILYADRETESIKTAVKTTRDRRARQEAFNKEHGIIPETIIKSVPEAAVQLTTLKHLAKSDIPRMVKELQNKMQQAAEMLDFEKAIELRNLLRELERAQK